MRKTWSFFGKSGEAKGSLGPGGLALLYIETSYDHMCYLCIYKLGICRICTTYNNCKQRLSLHTSHMVSLICENS